MLDTTFLDHDLLFDDELDDGGSSVDEEARHEALEDPNAVDDLWAGLDQEGEFLPKTAEQHNAHAEPAVPRKPPVYADPDIPAEQRIEQLLSSMNARRRVIMGTLGFCCERKPIEDVNAYVDELQANDKSVYSGAILCGLLQKAGALERIDEDEKTLSEAAREPIERVDEDGNAYLEIPPLRQSYWVATPAGAATFASYDPIAPMMDFFDTEAPYKRIYRQILEMCAAEEGTTAKAVADAVEDDPLLEKPRRFGAYFVEKLDELNAISWVGRWEITDTGRTGLAYLCKDMDAAEADGGMDVTEVQAETQTTAY